MSQLATQIGHKTPKRTHKWRRKRLESTELRLRGLEKAVCVQLVIIVLMFLAQKQNRKRNKGQMLYLLVIEQERVAISIRKDPFKDSLNRPMASFAHAQREKRCVKMTGKLYVYCST